MEFQESVEADSDLGEHLHDEGLGAVRSVVVDLRLGSRCSVAPPARDGMQTRRRSPRARRVLASWRR